MPPLSSPRIKSDPELEQEHDAAVDPGSVSPKTKGGRAGSVVSMEDPDVRIAAEALGDLRADFVQSPPESHSTLPAEKPPANGVKRCNEDGSPMSPPTEPLLSLLTTSHPLISTAINGSLSAYSTSKSYSPSFKFGAEFVERHVGSPVASTVGTVGRRSGVESGVRWWLGRRPSASGRRLSIGEEEEGSNKRRKFSESKRNSVDVEKGLPRYSTEFVTHEFFPRRDSQLSQISQISQISIPESLPAYDDHRSPGYEGPTALATLQRSPSGHASPTSTWQTRLMLSTSGLGVAMSEESLRSLRYCLTWLRWANAHIGKVISALQDLIDEWDQMQRQSRDQIKAEPSDSDAGSITGDGGADETSKPKLLATVATPDQAAITQRIAALKGDLMQTLKKVVNIVSRYAGGALPENARLLVRRHLTSLPQRFHVASRATTPSVAPDGLSDTVGSAHRVIVLAKEGLDMMAQVSGVVDGTVASAEEWCSRLGRRRRSDPEDSGAADNVSPKDGADVKDHKMEDADEVDAKKAEPLAVPQIDEKAAAA
ncbi:MAG: hypothetical protein M1825_001790 [Sarcosagium campestre]|nr:MAG: hypothetical protein M1825_001790 [Sarcosagium campestre]